MDYIIKVCLQILDGLNITLGTFVITLVLSLPLGVVVAMCRLSKVKILSKITELYIWVLRGTPLLLQILSSFLACLRWE